MEILKNKIIIACLCALISFVALFFNERYTKSDEFLYTLILTCGVTLLTNSIAFVVSYFFSDKNNLENSINKIASEKFSCIKYCHNYGLIGIYDKIPIDNGIIKKDFLNSANLYIIMNDAKAFISANLPFFEERIKIKNGNTTFVLQNYEQTDIMNALTRKNGHEGIYYKKKIRDVIEYHIKKFYQLKENNHSVNLYLNNNYNTLAMILSDNYAIVSIYRLASEKTTVPHFLFRKDGTEYMCIKKDIDKILENTKEVNLTN